MEKVKVSKEVFEALVKWEEIKNKPLETALKLKSRDTPFISSDFIALNKLSVEDLAKCFILGYELEETPEEKLLKYYKELGFMFNSSGTKVYVGLTKEQDVILETLSILGIKIKGINA